jgi:spoIIIJ-associated protein
MMKFSTKLPPVQTVIENVLYAMGFQDFQVALQASAIPGHITYNISGSESALLIGRDGRNLQALSKIIREILYFQAHSKDTTVDKHFDLTNFVIDVDDYQRTETAKLLATVDNLITKINLDGVSQAELPPMPSFQRRIIHAYVQAQESFTTESVGDYDKRRVIIKLNNTNE